MTRCKMILTSSGVELDLFSSLEFGFLLEVHPPHPQVGPVSFAKSHHKCSSPISMQPCFIATKISQIIPK